MNDYFTERDAIDYAFYRVPKALITDPQYRSVSTDAKLLYGLLLDRMDLSVKKRWLDEYGRVYLFYTIASIQTDLCCCKEKACRLLRELEQAGLIENKRQGRGSPSRIYVKHFSRGRKTRLLKVGKTDPNHTERTRLSILLG